METTIGKLDLEHDLVQLLTKEAVKAGLASALREPILAAVEETTGEAVEVTGKDDASEGREKSRLTKVVQGGTVFVVMFVVLYITLRRLTSDEAD